MKESNLIALKDAVALVEPRIEALDYFKDSDVIIKNGAEYHTFIFAPANAGNKLRLIIESNLALPSLHMTIEKTEKQYIRMSDYLKEHGNTLLEDLDEQRILNKDAWNARDYFKEILAVFIRYLETDLRDVLEGKRWEIVPIDYMGYR